MRLLPILFIATFSITVFSWTYRYLSHRKSKNSKWTNYFLNVISNLGYRHCLEALKDKQDEFIRISLNRFLLLILAYSFILSAVIFPQKILDASFRIYELAFLFFFMLLFFPSEKELKKRVDTLLFKIPFYFSIVLSVILSVWVVFNTQNEAVIGELMNTTFNYFITAIIVLLVIVVFTFMIGRLLMKLYRLFIINCVKKLPYDPLFIITGYTKNISFYFTLLSFTLINLV